MLADLDDLSGVITERFERLTPLIGMTMMIVSEAATLAHVEPFWSWNTPIA